MGNKTKMNKATVFFIVLVLKRPFRLCYDASESVKKMGKEVSQITV